MEPPVKTWLIGLVALTVAAPQLLAQARKPLPVTFEGVVGIAEFTESFADDCCGPARDATGVSLNLRVKERSGRLFEAGLEGGATFAGHREMKWLMAVLSIAAPRRAAPWVQIGGGLVAQPGECPADGPNTGPGCETDLKLGATVAGGIRWTVSDRLAVGVEAGYVRGKAQHSTRFTTKRLGVTFRIQ